MISVAASASTTRTELNPAASKSDCGAELSGDYLSQHIRDVPVSDNDKKLWSQSLIEKNVEMFDVQVLDKNSEVIYSTTVGGSVLTAIDYPAFKKIVDEAYSRIPEQNRWHRVVLNHTHQYPGAIFDWFPIATNRLFGNFRSEFSVDDKEFVVGAKAILDLMGFSQTTLEFGVVYPQELGRPNINSRLGKREYVLGPDFNFQNRSFSISERVSRRLKEWNLLPRD